MWRVEEISSRFNISERTLLVLCGLAFIVAFVLDITSPLGTTLNFLYLIPISLSLLSPRPRLQYYFAVLATILSLVAIPFKPPGSLLFPLINRPISITSFWILAGIISYTKDSLVKTKLQAKEIETLMDVVPAAIWIANDPEARVITGNKMADRIYESKVDENVSAGTITGEEWDQTRRFFHGGRELRPEELPMQQAMAKRKEVNGVELEVLKPSGRKLVMFGNAMPLFDDHGGVRGSIGSFIDITDRKRIEEALRESEARYRSLFETNKDILSLGRVVRDDQGYIIDTVIVDANPAALRAWGFSSIDLVKGKRTSELFDSITVEALIESVRRTMASKATFSIEVSYRERNYLSTFVPMDSENIIVSSSDITEIKIAQKWLEEYAGKLERSNAELQQFAYIASHDLQEPLRMIVTYLRLLDNKMAGKLDDRSREYLHYAVDGGTRMKKMIDDLLAYSRVESRGQHTQPIDMNEVLSLSLNDLKVSIADSGASITHGSLPNVVADKGQMIQVFDNLIGNAIKYRDVAAPQIHVSGEIKGREALFTVQDNGIGIDPKNYERIFQMFQRLHTREEYPGTGIGLAIVRKIVDMHGGRIWVQSEPGKGTTFFFTLPANAREVRSDQSEKRSADLPPTDGPI